MKPLTQLFIGKARLLACVLLVSSVAGYVQCEAVDLTSGNSTVAINIGNGSPGSAGVFDWAINGVDQLTYQWFYYRVGSAGPEYPIENIGPAVIGTQTASRLDLSYANADYSVAIRFLLAGGSAGVFNAGFNQTITLQNTSAEILDFHFFQYSDFDLSPYLGGQNVLFTPNLLGQYNTATQTGGPWRVTETVTSAAVPIGHVNAAPYDPTYQGMLDALPTTVGDNYAAGPGNVTFIYQWDLTLAPGGAVQISKILQAVPEPSSTALLLAGILASALLRRRH